MSAPNERDASAIDNATGHVTASAADGTGTPPTGGPPPTEPPRSGRRKRHLLRWLSGALALLLALTVALAVAALAAAQTARGTRWLWRAACELSAGRLSGTLTGGTLARGLQIDHLAWRDAHDSVGIDHLDGTWSLTRAPWRFSIDYLHAGTVDLAFGPSSSAARPPTLPGRLTLPLQLAVRSVRIDRLRWHETGGGKPGMDAPLELEQIALHGGSDGVRHRLTLDSLRTSAGSVSGSVTLNGRVPYALSGGVAYAGRVADQTAEISARLTGNLSALTVDLNAGSRDLGGLTGRAHLEVTPFAPVPFKTMTLSADHLDLQAFDSDAPQTEISLRAGLQPLPAPAHAAGLTVAGPVAITNATPGPLYQHRLPLASAQARITLDARQQRVDDLALAFFGGGRASGAGSFASGSGSASTSAAQAQGHVALNLSDFDWSVLSDRLKPVRLGGTLALSLAPRSTATLDLADPRAGVRLRGQLHADAAELGLDGITLDAGQGRLELSGTLKRNAAADYALQSRVNRFDPFTVVQAQAAAPTRKAQHAGLPRQSAPFSASISGTLAVQGALSQNSANLTLALRDSLYDGLPLTGTGTVRMLGNRVMPSQLAVSIAGNQVELHGAFGAPGDHLAFHLDAPHLDRLGLGVRGTAQADGRLGGSFNRPDLSADYRAADLGFGAYRLGHAQGRVELHDGAAGVLALTLDATDLAVPGAMLHTVSAQVDGTRAKHTLSVHATGTVQKQPLDLTVAAHGGLTEGHGGTGWTGVVTELANRALPAVQLLDPLNVTVGPDQVELSGAQGSAHLDLEGAAIELRRLQYQHGALSAAGSARGIDVDRLMRLSRTLTGANTPFKTDLILDGDWDFTLADHARGYVQLQRRTGDITLSTWRGAAAMGFSALTARLDFGGDNQAKLSLRADAARLGHLSAALQAGLTPQDGLLGLTDASVLSGTLSGEIPSLRTTGGLFGPAYVLDGSLRMQLKLAGVLGHPRWSGEVDGDDLAATLIDQGIQFKQGKVDIDLTDNLLQIRQLLFHGASGTLSANGRIKLDEANPDLGINVLADKLELFATPDRQLQISGQAAVRNAGSLGDAGDITVDGRFKVDHALFDLPDSPMPSLGNDVHIVQADGSEVDASKPALAAADGSVNGTPGATPAAVAAAQRAGAAAQQAAVKAASPMTPRTHIAIDLGNAFRFRGAGADLGLRGQLAVTSAPDQPLRAVGNVNVTPDSTYTTFGRKLSIDTGYFTFNGPIDNPGINIVAMRHNQEVVAGVQVSGTVQAPVAKLVSEPNVPDNEKLSWLLFGHGTDTGSNLSQQSAMTEAFALLGNAGGKRVAQTLGLDEVSIGQSEVGLTDPQVVMLSKALNQRVVLGYEQGLSTAASVLKVTLNLSRFWSIALHTGAVNGVTLLFNRRFD